MRQRGFIPIIFLLVCTIIGVVAYFAIPYAYKATQNDSLTTSFLSPEPTKVTVTGSNNPLVTPTTISSSTPTLKPTFIKTPTPKPTSIVSASCGINYFPDPQNPLVGKLIYSASSINGSYMTGAQWDFDGNGSWDTDMTQSNGTIDHTFPSAGNYTVELHLKMSDGTTTNICSRSVTVSQVTSGFTVKLTGRVYEDANCNDMQEPSEGGIPNVTINLIKSDYSVIEATITSNSSGYYEFSRALAQGQSLTVIVSGVAASGYKIHANKHTVTLSSGQQSMNIDLPQVPASYIGSCQ